MPNPKEFQYEPSSGYFYDPETGFYHDPKTDFYYCVSSNTVNKFEVPFDLLYF